MIAGLNLQPFRKNKLPKTLILGIGNILLGDEGFGVAAINYLEKYYTFPKDVRLLDGGTRGLMLLGEIIECDFLVVLDIMLGGEKPGSIYLVEEEEIPERVNFRHSMHEANLSDMLASAELAGNRPRTLVFGFEPFDFETLNPSPTAQALRLLPQFCDKVAGELARRGLDIYKNTEK